MSLVLDDYRRVTSSGILMKSVSRIKSCIRIDVYGLGQESFVSFTVGYAAESKNVVGSKLCPR